MKKIKIFTEFKEFAMKGNVIDMAVGVIIGGAFSKIVSSLVNDIIMPLLSLIIGRINLADLSLTIEPLGGGAPIQLAYGLFLQNILDFLIVAICIFIAVKLINILYKKQAKKPEPPKPAAPPKQELLLEEIRDILKGKK